MHEQHSALTGGALLYLCDFHANDEGLEIRQRDHYGPYAVRYANHQAVGHRKLMG